MSRNLNFSQVLFFSKRERIIRHQPRSFSSCWDLGVSSTSWHKGRDRKRRWGEEERRACVKKRKKKWNPVGGKTDGVREWGRIRVFESSPPLCLFSEKGGIGKGEEGGKLSLIWEGENDGAFLFVFPFPFLSYLGEIKRRKLEIRNFLKKQECSRLLLSSLFGVILVDCKIATRRLSFEKNGKPQHCISTFYVLECIFSLFVLIWERGLWMIVVLAGFSCWLWLFNDPLRRRKGREREREGLSKPLENIAMTRSENSGKWNEEVKSYFLPELTGNKDLWREREVLFFS